MILINEQAEVIFTGMPVLWHGNLLKLGSFVFCFCKHKLNDYMAMCWAVDLAALCWKLITFDNFSFADKAIVNSGQMFWNYSQMNSDLIHLAVFVSQKGKVSGRTDDPCDTYISDQFYFKHNGEYLKFKFKAEWEGN